MYIDRDDNGKITGVFARQQHEGQESLDHESQEIQSFLFSKDYRKEREAEYPPIGDQLDAIMKWVAGENEITVTPELKSIAMTCMSVKAKYPKT